MDEFTDRLESFKGLKDVKYIVYRHVHQHKLRKCFRSMFFRMEWNEEKCCWTTRSVGKFLKRRKIFNYRSLDLFIHDPSYIFIHTVETREYIGICRVRSAKNDNNNYVTLPLKYRYSSNDINLYIY